MNGSDSARATVGDYMGCDRKRIWCLGTRVEGFRSVFWSDSNVSFADCDVLVVTVETLNQIMLDGLTADARNSLSSEILKRFNQNKMLIICIMAETIAESTCAAWTNYFWCPVQVSVRKMALGATQLQDRCTGDLAHFQGYFDSIEQYEIGMPGLEPGPNMATTGSGDAVGCAVNMGLMQGISVYQDKFLIMLHPLKTREESVNKVLEILNPSQPVAPPNWADDIPIRGTSDDIRKIAALEKRIETEREEIEQLQNQIDDKHQYRKLAYAQGQKLEEVVGRALTLVGIRGLERGEQGKEDFVFTPRTDPDYPMCVVEVKGITGGIKMRDLSQLERWIVNHWGKEVKAKGLFVVNAFCSQDLAGRSSDIISSTNLRFAKDRQFCILPTPVLLGLCNRVLGGDAVPADQIERVLMSSSGVVSLDDFA